MKIILKSNFRLCVKYLISFILMFTLFSCEMGNYNDTPYAGSSDPPVTSNENPYSDPADRSILTLNMSISAEYSQDDNLAKFYINVFDQDGNFIDTMNPDNFEVVMNNNLVVTSSYRTLSIEDADTNLVGLILDSSGSMEGQRMDDAKEAAKMFIDTMTGTDQTAIIDFDSDARVAKALTSDKDSLKTAIDELVADGGTNIGSAIIKCVEAVGSRPGKTAGILLTDGVDGGGFIDDGIQKAQTIGIPIYSIFLGTDITDIARDDMQRIADDTGGEYYEVVGASELQNVFSNTIPEALAARPSRSSYLITLYNVFPYYSTVDVLITLRYFNAWGMHIAEFMVTYDVGPYVE